MQKTPFHDINRDNLVALFEKGDKPGKRLGFELEHVLVRKGTRAPVAYDEPNGVRDILERLAPFYAERHFEGGNLVGLSRPGAAITIEPAAQLELSAGPFNSVFEVEAAYLAFRDELDPVLEEFGVETPMLGYNPSACAKDLQLVPKYRYECMTRFLGAEAYEGICMMRGTTSLQVSIDYRDEADALRKLRIAEAIAPVLALICDNAPIFEGRERKANMVRTAVWAGMNQDRVGTVPGSLDPGFSFADYADYILSRGAILVPDDQAPEGWRFVGGQTFDEVYADREMTRAELEHALSMVWPDARLKNFVEIRPADAMPLEYCLAYVVLIRALFYSDRNLGVLESLLASVDEARVREAKQALMQKGYGAEIYGRPVEFWADLLIVLATGSLEPGEQVYLEPIASMVKYRFTLAEIWPRMMEKRTKMPAGSPVAPVIGVVPRYDFEWTGLAISDGYLSGLLETGALPIVLPTTNDPAHIERLVSLCDGFLIPGGQDIDPSRYGARRKPHTHRSATSRDLMEKALVKAVVAADKPLLGICRGMQSLNVALGGTLHQDILAQIAERPKEDDPVLAARADAPSEPGQPTEPGQHVQGRPFDVPAHMVEIQEDSLLAQCVGATRLGVNTIHHQSIDQLGEGLVVCAVSPEDGVVEGIEMPGARFVLGVQWHPEYMWRERPHSKRLFKALIEAASRSRDARM